MKRLNFISTVIENNGSYASSPDDDNYTNSNQITNDKIIVSATPFSMNSVPYNISPKILNVSTLFFIAQTKSGDTCVLYTSYLSEEEIEDEMIKSSPFHVDNNFSSFRICADIIVDSFPTYITDFIFDYNNEEEYYKFSIMCKNIDNSNDPTRFYMSSDVFCSIKYIDNYLFDGNINNYELSMASISGREMDNLSKVIMVEKIDSIAAVVQIKKSTTYAIEFIVVNGENKYTILSTFDLGKKFNRKKSKGITIDKLNNTFLKDSDQYLQIFSEFCKFNNINKEYLIIKAKNKDNINNIFMIDEDIKTEFEKMIFEY